MADLRDWIRRKLYCWRHGHDWADKSPFPGPNYCLRCGGWWEWVS